MISHKWLRAQGPSGHRFHSENFYLFIILGMAKAMAMAKAKGKATAKVMAKATAKTITFKTGAFRTARSQWQTSMANFQGYTTCHVVTS